MRLPALVLAIVLLATTPAAAQFSGQYPRDVGIENDTRVIFSEKFAGTVAQITSRFSNVTSGTGTSVVADAPSAAAPGTQSLQMGGGSFQSFFKNLVTNYDVIHLRYYVKYTGTADYGAVHNGVWLIGANPPSNFLPPGLCCAQPTGSDKFYIGTEIGTGPGVDDSFDFYAGWMEMHGTGIIDVPDCGGECFFGNSFLPDSLLLTRNAWNVVEVMVKMNTTGASRDGELRAWVNGVEVGHFGPGFPLGSWSANVWTTAGSGTPFEGFRWRATTAFAVNGLWLLYNGSGNPNGMRLCCVVAATERVGPISAAATPGTPSNVQISLLLSPLMVGLVMARRRIAR